jgi:hypothetical protein
MPLSFVSNAGQADPAVRYLARGDGVGYFFTSEGVVSSFQRGGREGSVRLRPVGSRPGVTIEPRVEGGETVTLFRGSSRVADVAAFRELVYEDLWPGIDMVFHGRGSRLEYEFRVAPGADPSKIQLAYDGARDVGIRRHARLRVATALGTLDHAAPRSTQVVAGKRVTVASRYVRGAVTRSFRLAIAAYDRTLPLVVDASPSYSTQFGGTSNDFGIDIAVDRRGNAFVTGQTITPDFPATPGALDGVHAGAADAFVVKIDPSGSELLYATYLGGSAAEAGLSIAVDDTGHAYVSGGTGSPDFPTTAGAFDRTDHTGEDVWVAKLNPDGSSLEYSTLLGGSAIAGDFGAAIAIDDAGHAYVAGGTGSLDFPSTASAFQSMHRGETNSLDAFVAKLEPDGSGLVFATFIGGGCNDAVTGIAVDAREHVFVTGSTVSRDFPTTAKAFERGQQGDEDAFVAELGTNGDKLVDSTLLGGKSFDRAQGIAVDGAGRASITGWTTSVDFPTTLGAFDTRHRGVEDAFVARFDAGVSKLVYSTYLGGAGNDRGRGIAVDAAGNAYVTGATASADFPTTRRAGTAQHVGDQDAFVTKMNPNGSRLAYSTFVGGTALDFGRAIAVDADRNAYVTGRTESADFPTTGSRLGATAGRDAFVLKLGPNGR